MSRKSGTKAIDCSPTPEDANKLMQVARDPIDKFILACAMFLGLDKGVIAHYRNSWVLQHENRIKVPDEQLCDKFCCKKLNGVWRPKGKRTKKGNRVTYRNIDTGYYGQFPWAKEVIKTFSAAYDKFPLTERAINLRLDRMIRDAKTSRRITVHGLRSFAASNYANMLNGDMLKLCQVMGWEVGSPMAEKYVRQYELKKAIEEGSKRSLI